MKAMHSQLRNLYYVLVCDFAHPTSITCALSLYFFTTILTSLPQAKAILVRDLSVNPKRECVVKDERMRRKMREQQQLCRTC